jgi:hypothetical protein
MIHHVSIPAHDPVRVAAVLAELMGGRDYPFTGPLPGARMAVSGDPNGTMIEVYPETVVLAPGTGENPVSFAEDVVQRPYTPFHVLLSVPLERAAIEHIGAREGWRTRFFGRGRPGQPPVFHLLEFWVENRIMLEVVPAEMAGPYERYMQFEALDRITAAGGGREA